MLTSKNRFNLNRLLVLFVILGVLALSACGDSTATQSVPATTTSASTAGATTAVPDVTTVPPTTALATTAPATTASTKAATTASVSTTIPATNNSSLKINGAQEVQFDKSIAAELFKEVPGAEIRIFASADDSAKLSANAHTAILATGYKFAIPGQTKPVKDDNASYLGVYSKTGAPSLVLISSDLTKDQGELESKIGIPGVSAEETQKLLAQLNGKTSSAIIITDPSDSFAQLMIGFSQLGSDNPTTPVPTSIPVNRPPTFAPTTASNKTLTVDESALPVYPGAKRIETSPGKVGNQITVYYVSTDSFDTIKDWAKNTFDPFTGDEFNGRSIVTDSFTSKLSVQGKNYDLKLTILNPRAQAQDEYKEIVKLAKAGPDDIVMIAIITPPAF